MRIWHVFAAWLISAMLTLASPQSLPDSSQDSFKPAAVAGLICRSFDPWQYQEQMRLLQVSSGETLNDFSADVDRTLKRRYSDRTHLPFPKGSVLVAAKGQLEFWDCEECDDVNGAGELVADFAKQWMPAKDAVRPNYEAEVQRLSGNSWKVSYVNLSWLTKLEPTSEEEFKKTGQKQKVTWSVTRRPGRATWFRHEGGWLWSGTRETLLQASQLSLLLQPHWRQAPEEQPLVTMWVTPPAVPGHLKKAVEAQALALLWTQKQTRDLGADRENDSRSLAKLLQIRLLQLFLNETDLIVASLDRSEEGFSINAKITPRRASEFGTLLESLVSQTPRSWRAAANETGIRGFLQIRIPMSVVDILSAHRTRPEQDIDLCVSVAGVCESVKTARFEADCRSGQIAHVESIMQRLFVGIPDSAEQLGIPMKTIVSRRPEKQALGAVISWPHSEQPTHSSFFDDATDAESHSGGELRLELDSAAVAALTNRPVATAADNERRWLKASMQWSRAGARIRLDFPEQIARQWLEAAVLQSSR